MGACLANCKRYTWADLKENNVKFEWQWGIRIFEEKWRKFNIKIQNLSHSFERNWACCEECHKSMDKASDFIVSVSDKDDDDDHENKDEEKFDEEVTHFDNIDDEEE